MNTLVLQVMMERGVGGGGIELSRIALMFASPYPKKLAILSTPADFTVY